MSNNETIAVDVHLRNIIQEPVRVTLKTHKLDSSERMSGALKLLGIFWAIMIFCVFIPVLHFILVPSFFVLGIVFSIRKYKVLERLLPGPITCPQCKGETQFTGAPLKFPIRENCTLCQAQLRLEPVGPSGTK